MNQLLPERGERSLAPDEIEQLKRIAVREMLPVLEEHRINPVSGDGSEIVRHATRFFAELIGQDSAWGRALAVEVEVAYVRRALG